MLVPVTLYDVLTGTSADDAAATVVATALKSGVADEISRSLMRLRDQLDGAPEFFVRPRKASHQAESAEAAQLEGYDVRWVLAPITPAEGIQVVEPPAPVADPKEGEEAQP
jgi:hypothetical protein